MKRSYPDRPIVGVGVVVLNADKVLLVKRGNPPKAEEWSLPGGAQDIGETLQEAGIREVKEETGLTITISGLVDAVDFIEKDDFGKPRFHYSLIDFWAVSSDRELRPGDDALSVQWAAHDRIDALPLWSETKRVIHKAFKLRDKSKQ
ncbi:MAG: NUDIX hydrolase [Pseudomonadota bacterium]